MKTFKLLFLVTLILSFLSCKNEQRSIETPEAVTSTYYFIRHAEKDRTDPGNIDPELNQKGLGRAMHWAEILKDIPLDAIYTTDYERTAMTAAPSAVKQDLNVTYYDPETVDINQFKNNHLGQNVLVVGHSNSTPTFVNKVLGEERYESMSDYDNGSLFIVQITGSDVSSQRLHFNCNCPD
ncbi:SixA phosphatase family protein [Eudoraea sp.]|uniref:SixA phosphatase family protein n=1 Tax=Eudoraea sp. TaxID=1979955 RepID=UPI003C710EA2